MLAKAHTSVGGGLFSSDGPGDFKTKNRNKCKGGLFRRLPANDRYRNGYRVPLRLEPSDSSRPYISDQSLSQVIFSKLPSSSSSRFEHNVLNTTFFNVLNTTVRGRSWVSASSYTNNNCGMNRTRPVYITDWNTSCAAFVQRVSLILVHSSRITHTV